MSLEHLMENLGSSDLHTVIRLHDQDARCQCQSENKQVFACTICSVVFCNHCPNVKISQTTITCPDGHKMLLK
jgi:hypothetical protein